MKLLCTLVFLLCDLQAAEGQRPRGKESKVKPAPTSGELITKGGHRCTWAAMGGGDKAAHLVISCDHDGKPYRCKYSGQPDLCLVHGVSPGRYWGQVVGGLQRKTHACREGGVLKARSCKAAPPDSHMRLLARARGEDRAAVRVRGEEGGRGMGRAPRRQFEEQRAAAVVANSSTPKSDTDPVESYCADGWHTVCSFFLSFFDG